MTLNPDFSPCLEELLDRSPVFISPETTLSLAYPQIRSRGYGFILKSGEFPRIFTLRDILREIDAGRDPERSTVGETTGALTEYLFERDFEDIFRLALEMPRHRIQYLPVFNDAKQLLGVITPRKIISILKSSPIVRSTPVSEIINPRIVTAAANTPTREIVRLLNVHRTDLVIIVDEEGKAIDYRTADGAIEELDRTAGEKINSSGFAREDESLGIVLERLETLGQDVLPAIDVTGKPTGSIGYLEALQVLHPARLYRDLERQQQQTRQSEEQLRLILDNAPSYIYIIDESGIVRFINRVPEGMAIGDVIGHHTAEAVEPESRAGVYSAIERVFTTGETVLYEKSGIGDQFRVAHYQTRMARFDHPRLGKAAIVITTDITDLKNAELALRENEEKFRQLAETLPQVFFIYTLDPYRCLYISPGFEKLTGFPCQTLYENPAFWLTRIHPDDRSRVERAVWREIEGYPVDEEYRAFRADGRMFWVHNKSFPVFDERGRVKRTVGFAEDITDRVHLKIALEQVSQGIAAYTGEDFFSSLVRYLSEALGVDIVFIGELLETGRLQMIAVYGDGEILPNFDCDLVNSPCQTLIGRQVQHYPERVRELFPKVAILQELGVEGYLGIPLWKSDRQPLGVLGIFHRSPLHDIKLPIELLKIFAVRASAELERQAATRALFQLNQELESRVAKRTRELEILLKEIHHRVKNNLNVMSHLLEWQARLLPDPETRAVFQESQTRIQTMALIHDQLYQTGNLVTVNLSNYIEQLVNNIFFTYGYGKERYQLALDLQPIALSLEKAIPCGLIINELLTNAFKYAFPGGREGRIEISLSLTNHRSVHLTIHDNGVGIPNDFDWRESNTLGLKLVNILTRQIEGLSELDRDSGTTFHLIFNP